LVETARRMLLDVGNGSKPTGAEVEADMLLSI
jgi:hypothetical protein